MVPPPRRRTGRRLPYSSEADPDGEFDHVDTADAEHDLGTYVQMSVRWVCIHMIEEYARHNGHADLLRERIDDTTGF